MHLEIGKYMSRCNCYRKNLSTNEDIEEICDGNWGLAWRGMGRSARRVGATFARLSSSSCWTFLSGIFARRLIVRSVFPLGRNEAKRDDGCGGRPVAHPSVPIHAIMQVSPNERQHHHSNAEPQGRLLTK